MQQVHALIEENRLLMSGPMFDMWQVAVLSQFENHHFKAFTSTMQGYFFHLTLQKLRCISESVRFIFN